MNNFQKQKLKLKKYEDELKNKLASINKKKRYPTRIIENLNNKIRKLTENIIMNQEKQISKNEKQMKVNNMKNKIKEINNSIKKAGKPVDKTTKKLDKAYNRILKQAEKINEQYKGKNDWYKPKVVITKKYDYYLRIKFYKRGKIEEDEKEEVEQVYKNADVEFDNDGNIYHNIWNNQITVKLNQNPTDLKINEFYNDNDDGVQFISDYMNLFIQDKNFEEKYYQYFKSYINGFIISSISKVESLTDAGLEPIEIRR
jgi:small-conductance mechanosensitive channel